MSRGSRGGRRVQELREQRLQRRLNEPPEREVPREVVRRIEAAEFVVPCIYCDALIDARYVTHQSIELRGRMICKTVRLMREEHYSTRSRG